MFDTLKDGIATIEVRSDPKFVGAKLGASVDMASGKM